MKDMPVFSTELGVASLVLREIPYRKEAYIRYRSGDNIAAFLEECRSFCVAVGAEHVFVTGVEDASLYPEYATILKMQIPVESLPESDASLFPVQENSLELWQKWYNEKMQNVPVASYMSDRKAKEMLEKGSAYFVHKNGVCIGIGAVSDHTLQAVAALAPGAGAETVAALCRGLLFEDVSLEVASTNRKAMRLYQKLGFVTVAKVETWYRML